MLDDCIFDTEPQCQGQEFSGSGYAACCQLVEGMASDLFESNPSLVLSFMKAAGVSFGSYSQYLSVIVCPTFFWVTEPGAV
jgi:hypothetical protein